MVLSGLSQPYQRKLHVFDTKLEPPTKNTFLIRDKALLHILLEPCSYAPSPDEVEDALFYPNPSQRILALDLGKAEWLVIKIETLLKLAQNQSDKIISLEGWGKVVMARGGHQQEYPRVWISGCRMFTIHTDYRQSVLQIYNLSQGSNSKNLNANKGENEGEKISITLPRISGTLSGLLGMTASSCMW